jgi:hypothetical protein
MTQPSTICQATPITGQPCFLIANQSPAIIQNVDFITNTQYSPFVQYWSNVVSVQNTEIRPKRFRLKGTGVITQGYMVLHIDGNAVYAVNALKLFTQKPNMLLQGDLDQSYSGEELSLEFILSGTGINIKSCRLEYLLKEG